MSAKMRVGKTINQKSFLGSRRVPKARIFTARDPVRYRVTLPWMGEKELPRSKINLKKSHLKKRPDLVQHACLGQQENNPTLGSRSIESDQGRSFCPRKSTPRDPSHGVNLGEESA